MKKLEELGVSPMPWEFDADTAKAVDGRNRTLTRPCYVGDARLVAASPDLYNAARQAYELLSGIIEGTQSDGHAADGCKVHETLRRALEKAGGGGMKQTVCKDAEGDRRIADDVGRMAKEHGRMRPLGCGLSLLARAMGLPSVRSAIDGIVMKTAHVHPELLRCPNCGSMDSDRGKTDDGDAQIFCRQCGFTIVRASPQSAETEWNHLPGRFGTEAVCPKGADERLSRGGER